MADRCRQHLQRGALATDGSGECCYSAEAERKRHPRKRPATTPTHVRAHRHRRLGNGHGREECRRPTVSGGQRQRDQGRHGVSGRRRRCFCGWARSTRAISLGGSAGQRHRLCRRPASRPDPRRHDAGAAATRDLAAGPAGQEPDAGQARSTTGAASSTSTGAPAAFSSRSPARHERPPTASSKSSSARLPRPISTNGACAMKSRPAPMMVAGFRCASCPIAPWTI